MARKENELKNILIVIDMQNDFIGGGLGTKEAVGIVDAVCERIKTNDGPVIVTMDTHDINYLDTLEGKYLPVPHCIGGTDGWRLHEKVWEALKHVRCVHVEKHTFGCPFMLNYTEPLMVSEPCSITLCGLCTDICVISNALLLRTYYPEAEIKVDASCCAGTTPEKHAAALEVMRSCQIEVK